MALDERLREEFERAGQPADPSGVYEELIGRRERRRLIRRVKAGALAVAVAVGCIVGVLVLSRVFASSPVDLAAGGGQGIVFADGTGEETDLFVVQPDGTSLRRLTHDGGSGAARWSPDGTKMVFARYDDRTQTSDLFVMDADGSEIARLTDTPELSEAASSWSPDGSKIAFEASPPGGLPSQIFVMDADGGDVAQLTESAGDSRSPDWSPDGSRLVFHYIPTPSLDGSAGSEIWIMDADGTERRRLVGDGVSGNYDPRWSPDGGSIVFTHDRDVYIVKTDGTGLENLTPSDGADVYDRDAGWSSDGARIVFASGRTHDAALSLFTMNPDGSDVRPVLETPVGFCCPRPDWHGEAAVETGTIEPEPSPTDEPTPGVLGPEWSLCNVTTIDGAFAEPGVTSRVYVATQEDDTGCPQPDDALNVIALDANLDGRADTVLPEIQCELECRAFSAPDLDGDGTAELLVLQSGGSVVGLRLYDILHPGEGRFAIWPVRVAEPGDRQGGVEPGEEASFLLGGDAFELYALSCSSWDAGIPALVVTRAESLPHDSPDAEWHAHETTLVLEEDGELHVVDVRDFTEPVTDDPGGPSFRSEETLCGANLGP